MRILALILLLLISSPSFGAEKDKDTQILELKKMLVQSQLENLGYKYNQLRRTLQNLEKQLKDKGKKKEQKFDEKFPKKLH